MTAAHLHLAPSADDEDRSNRLPTPVRVLLADDHLGARRSIRHLLDRQSDLEVVAEAGDLPTVVQHMKRHRPRVLILDLRLPDRSTADTIRGLRSQAPEIEIVVLTMTDSPRFAQESMEAGAVGFVLKDRSDAELVTAIRAAARGEEYVSTRVAGRLDRLRQAVGDDGLTPRELEILRLVALGFTSREIAGSLHLSRRTIETHRYRIHGKLRFTTRAELVRFALEHRLIGT